MIQIINHFLTNVNMKVQKNVVVRINIRLKALDFY